MTKRDIFEELLLDREEATNLKIRSNLMRSLAQYIQMSEFTQEQIAQKLGISQPRVSDLVRGKINKFTIDMLVNMLISLDFELSIQVQQPKTMTGKDSVSSAREAG